MKFSQRIGLKPIKTNLQINFIDTDLKNRLWNIILNNFIYSINGFSYDRREKYRNSVYNNIWINGFNNRFDEIPRYSYGGIQEYDYFLIYLSNWWFNTAEWYEIYEFIEFILESYDEIFDLTTSINQALKIEVSGYRIVNKSVTQITSEEEILAIEEAILDTDKFKSVNTHLKSSLDLMSDKKNPDYRNSIKESISSVEAFCKIITNDTSATLGKALAEIEKRHALHGALKSSFSALYGYTSDSGGIRHALLEDDKAIEFEDAKFMLVSCSAFINYLKSKVKA